MEHGDTQELSPRACVNAVFVIEFVLSSVASSVSLIKLTYRSLAQPNQLSAGAARVRILRKPGALQI